MTWSATQYLAFEDDRTRPVRDLVAAIPSMGQGAMVDIGCGPGNSTEVLLARFPDAAVSGIDSSADMIAAARQRLPTCSFELADIADWKGPGPFEAILSNAALQWVPGHETLFPRLVGFLAPGGSLAVQMPDNLEEPAHVVMRRVAREGRWAAKVAAASGQRVAMAGVGGYYRLLSPLCRRVDIWRTTYFHVLADGADAVVEWFKGSGLRPFLAPLDSGEQGDFLAQYREEIATAYPALPDGSVLLPFPRLFIVATRS